MTKRRKHSSEFKRELVALSRQLGVSCRQIALEIGINPNLLSRRWREADGAIEKPSNKYSKVDESLSSANSTLKCDTPLCSLKVFLEHLFRLPEPKALTRPQV